MIEVLNMNIKRFLKEQRSSLLFALGLAIVGTAYVIFVDQSQTWLISPLLIYLPFVWAGFVGTVFYIVIAHKLKLNHILIFILLPLWYVGVIYGIVRLITR